MNETCTLISAILLGASLAVFASYAITMRAYRPVYTPSVVKTRCLVLLSICGVFALSLVLFTTLSMADAVSKIG